MSNSDKQFRIGCQSWGYDDWITKPGGETVFYPRGTKQSDMLKLYARIFDTIEVDATAYGTPQMSSIESWDSKAPKGFLFSFKVPREITHELSLGPRSLPVMHEFVSAVRQLGEKLGVILIQLPASFESTKENAQNLRDFLAVLPKDLKFAIEFRDPGWFVDWTYDELNEHRVALSLVAGKWVPSEVVFSAVTRIRTDFAYTRFMGVRDLETFDRISRDRSDEIEAWKDQILKLHAREIYVYMDNYFEGHAPATANKFKAMLGIPAIRPSDLEEQPSLF